MVINRQLISFMSKVKSSKFIFLWHTLYVTTIVNEFIAVI